MGGPKFTPVKEVFEKIEHAIAVIFVENSHAFTQFSMIAFFATRTFDVFRQPIIAALGCQLLIPHRQATSRGPSNKQRHLTVLLT